MSTKLLVRAALLAGLFGSAHAATVVDGLTFNVNYDFNAWSCQVTPGVPGCVANFARVGWLDAQTYYGNSEFNLAGLQSAGKATLTFSLTDQFGRIGAPGVGQAVPTPLAATFTLGAYVGDNVAEHPANFPLMATSSEFGNLFATFASGIGADGRSLLNIGDAFSFDVTGLYNAAVARGDSALGIGLRSSFSHGTVGASLYTFNGFQLTLDPAVTPVPEPETYALMLAGLGLIGAVARRRRR